MAVTVGVAPRGPGRSVPTWRRIGEVERRRCRAASRMKLLKIRGKGTMRQRVLRRWVGSRAWGAGPGSERWRDASPEEGEWEEGKCWEESLWLVGSPQWMS